MTLEIALLEVPMCIVYKMSGFSYQIMSRLITIPHISLANIVSGKRIVREFLQENANPVTVTQELYELLENHEYNNQMKSDLAQIREKLGEGDGARNMAQLVLSLI